MIDKNEKKCARPKKLHSALYNELVESNNNNQLRVILELGWSFIFAETYLVNYFS